MLTILHTFPSADSGIKCLPPKKKASVQGVFNTGLYFRTGTDVIALSPPLTVTPDIIDRIVAVLRRVLAKIP